MYLYARIYAFNPEILTAKAKAESDASCEKKPISWEHARRHRQIISLRRIYMQQHVLHTHTHTHTHTYMYV